MSVGKSTVRKIADGDVEAFVALRLEALHQAPLAFSSDPENDHAGSAESVRTSLQRNPNSIIIGAFHPGLVGCIGLYRERFQKSSHKVNLWGMYVTEAARGTGIGALLLDRAVETARDIPGVVCVQLSVTSAAPAAQRLYERAGFKVWGTEPDALRYADESAEENYMSLPL